MEKLSEPAGRSYVLPTILIAAVLQGWALYALHWALENKTWPATHGGWLYTCYATAIFIPVTAQFLAGQARRHLTWILIAAVGVLFGYFGWHQGAWVALTNSIEEPYSSPESGFLLAVILG